MRTKGQIEAEISQAILKFEKEHIGRGPEEIRAFVVADMIVVRERGVLTPAEIHLATASDGREPLSIPRLLVRTPVCCGFDEVTGRELCPIRMCAQVRVTCACILP